MKTSVKNKDKISRNGKKYDSVNVERQPFRDKTNKTNEMSARKNVRNSKIFHSDLQNKSGDKLKNDASSRLNNHREQNKMPTTKSTPVLEVVCATIRPQRIRRKKIIFSPKIDQPKKNLLQTNTKDIKPGRNLRKSFQSLEDTSVTLPVRDKSQKNKHNSQAKTKINKSPLPNSTRKSNNLLRKTPRKNVKNNTSSDLNSSLKNDLLIHESPQQNIHVTSCYVKLVQNSSQLGNKTPQNNDSICKSPKKNVKNAVNLDPEYTQSTKIKTQRKSLKCKASKLNSVPESHYISTKTEKNRKKLKSPTLKSPQKNCQLSNRKLLNPGTNKPAFSSPAENYEKGFLNRMSQRKSVRNSTSYNFTAENIGANSSADSSCADSLKEVSPIKSCRSLEGKNFTSKIDVLNSAKRVGVFAKSAKKRNSTPGNSGAPSNKKSPRKSRKSLENKNVDPFAVYEFEYNPEEEPKPKKKKRKRPKNIDPDTSGEDDNSMKIVVKKLRKIDRNIYKNMQQNFVKRQRNNNGTSLKTVQGIADTEAARSTKNVAERNKRNNCSSPLVLLERITTVTSTPVSASKIINSGAGKPNKIGEEIVSSFTEDDSLKDTLFGATKKGGRTLTVTQQISESSQDTASKSRKVTDLKSGSNVENPCADSVKKAVGSTREANIICDTVEDMIDNISEHSYEDLFPEVETPNVVERTSEIGTISNVGTRTEANRTRDIIEEVVSSFTEDDSLEEEQSAALQVGGVFISRRAPQIFNSTVNKAMSPPHPWRLNFLNVRKRPDIFSVKDKSFTPSYTPDINSIGSRTSALATNNKTAAFTNGRSSNDAINNRTVESLNGTAASGSKTVESDRSNAESSTKSDESTPDRVKSNVRDESSVEIIESSVKIIESTVEDGAFFTENVERVIEGVESIYKNVGSKRKTENSVKKVVDSNHKIAQPARKILGSKNQNVESSKTAEFGVTNVESSSKTSKPGSNVHSIKKSGTGNAKLKTGDSTKKPAEIPSEITKSDKKYAETSQKTLDIDKTSKSVQNPNESTTKTNPELKVHRQTSMLQFIKGSAPKSPKNRPLGGLFEDLPPKAPLSPRKALSAFNYQSTPAKPFSPTVAYSFDISRISPVKNSNMSRISPVKNPNETSLFGFSFLSDDEDSLKENKENVPVRRSPRKKQKDNCPSRFNVAEVKRTLLKDSEERSNDNVGESVDENGSKTAEKEVETSTNATDTFDAPVDDSMSVHLFDDVEDVFKVTKKSVRQYTRKYTKRRRLPSVESNESDAESERKVHVRKKHKDVRTKEEEEEVDRLASHYNSMFEEIERYSLQIE